MCMCTCIRAALVLRVRAASARALEGERAEQDQSGRGACLERGAQR